MGFALWRQPPLLLCAGTHEYRPMGTAVIGDQGLFESRDFKPQRVSPRRGQDGFIGYFASLNEVNRYLRGKVEVARGKRNSHRILATFP
jgi:hypothetical protein